MKAYAYLRVSTEEQRDRQTIQTQREALRRFAERESYEIVAEFVDDGVSGTIPFSERLGGSLLLKDVPAGSVLLVYASDRIGRETLVTLDAWRRFDRQGFVVRSATEGD